MTDGEPPAPPTESAEAEVAADLVRRIAAGDRTAEDELVERYSRGVRWSLCRLSGRPELADDLHQETFRVVIERLRDRGLEEPERLGGFLNRTAKNLYRGHARKTARRKTDGGESLRETADPASDPLGDVLRAERGELVRRLLAELRPRDRQILYRFYLAEEPKERICADLGLDSLHFNRVLFRAKQRLRRLVERSDRRRRLESEARRDDE